MGPISFRSALTMIISGRKHICYKKREVLEIACKKVDLRGHFERILFIGNRMQDKITCGKVQVSPPDGIPVLI